MTPVFETWLFFVSNPVAARKKTCLVHAVSDGHVIMFCHICFAFFPAKNAHWIIWACTYNHGVHLTQHGLLNNSCVSKLTIVKTVIKSIRSHGASTYDHNDLQLKFQSLIVVINWGLSVQNWKTKKLVESRAIISRLGRYANNSLIIL